MKIIVGLGNPGEKYNHNRHNVGFMVVDQLAKELDLKFETSRRFKAEIIQTPEYILAKPLTFMNDSGVSVEAMVRFYKVKRGDIYIVHDDLDIALSNYKIQFGKGPQIHNGLGSIEEKLGHDQFHNVRVGVENRSVRGNKGIPGMVYSLQDFSPAEQTVVEDVIARAVTELVAVVS